MASLPPGIPGDVRLLDHSWLSDQRASGARLVLVPPGQDEAERRLRTERSANQALLATLAELERRASARESKLGSARAALTALMADHRQLEERSEWAEGELSTVRSQMAAVTERADRGRTEAQAELGRAEAALDSVMSEVWQLQHHNQQAELELEAAEARIAQLEADAHHQHEQREQRIRDLQTAFAATQVELAQVYRALKVAERPVWKKLLRRS